MATLSENLELSRCPHCSIDKPNLKKVFHIETNNHQGISKRLWGIYVCSRCGGIVSAWSSGWQGMVVGVYPSTEKVDAIIPAPAHDYLQQALNSIHAPAGAVMLAASAVDAMFKSKGYKEGSLYKRIDEAAKNHLITADMAQWAHEVRLDANDQRHADEQFALPSEEIAKRAVDFALVLGEILFVLPSRVQRGLEKSAKG
jgi:hypothetical protein